MTLILAAWHRGGAVLASDQQISDPHGNPAGPVTKLRQVGACAAATFGGRVDVPAKELFHGLDEYRGTAGALAETLLREREVRGWSEAFGVVIVGKDGTSSPLIAVLDRAPHAVLYIRPGNFMVARGIRHGFEEAPDFERDECPVESLLEVFRRTADENKAVGPKYDFAIVRHHGDVTYIRDRE